MQRLHHYFLLNFTAVFNLLFIFPPFFVDFRIIVPVYILADFRVNNPEVFGIECSHFCQRFVPGMRCQGKFGIVYRDHPFGIQLFHRFDVFSRHKMNVSPVFIILSVFKNYEIKTAIFLTNLFKMIIVAAVATDVDPLFGSFKNKIRHGCCYVKRKRLFV